MGITACGDWIKVKDTEITSGSNKQQPIEEDKAFDELTCVRHNVSLETINAKVKLALDRGKARRSHNSSNNLIIENQLQDVAKHPFFPVRHHISSNDVTNFNGIKKNNTGSINKGGVQPSELPKKTTTAATDTTVSNPTKSPAIIPKVSIPFDAKHLVLENKASFFLAYEILTMLGKGSYGKVLKVRHRESGQFYALKQIKKKYCRCNSEINKEIEILRRLVTAITHFVGSPEYCQGLRVRTNC